MNISEMTTAKGGTSCSQAHGVLEVPPVTSLANYCTIAGLDSQTALILEPQHTSINGNISVSPGFGDLFCFYGLVIIYIQVFWKMVKSKHLGLSSYTDLRRTLGSCSAEHSGHLPRWQHTADPACLAEAQAHFPWHLYFSSTGKYQCLC